MGVIPHMEKERRKTGQREEYRRLKEKKENKERRENLQTRL